jgi:hypothetical protein
VNSERGCVSVSADLRLWSVSLARPISWVDRSSFSWRPDSPHEASCGGLKYCHLSKTLSEIAPALFVPSAGAAILTQRRLYFRSKASQRLRSAKKSLLSRRRWELRSAKCGRNHDYDLAVRLASVFECALKVPSRLPSLRSRSKSFRRCVLLVCVRWSIRSSSMQ